VKLSFLQYTETIALIKLSYFKEQFRRSPVLTSIAGLFVALVLVQSFFVLLSAFSPLPKEMETMIKEHITQIKIGFITVLPIAGLFRQIFLTPLLIEKSNQGFFKLFPIPNFFLVITRWGEGGLSSTEVSSMSFLFLILSWESEELIAAVCQTLVWWFVIRSLVAMLYELYCIISDSLWLTIPMYILLYVWLMADVLVQNQNIDIPKMSAFWAWVDAEAVQTVSLKTLLLITVTSLTIGVGLWSYSYRMKNILLKT
jgi:hypothetical protein